jgi:hypothetical protein
MIKQYFTKTGFKATSVINDIAIRDIRGDYDLTINSEKYKWKIDGEVAAPKSEVTTTDNKK